MFSSPIVLQKKLFSLAWFSASLFLSFLSPILIHPDCFHFSSLVSTRPHPTSQSLSALPQHLCSPAPPTVWPVICHQCQSSRSSPASCRATPSTPACPKAREGSASTLLGGVDRGSSYRCTASHPEDHRHSTQVSAHTVTCWLIEGGRRGCGVVGVGFGQLDAPPDWSPSGLSNSIAQQRCGKVQ